MLPLLLTTFFLGLRHGIDWDHIAAITDITSTTVDDHHHEFDAVMVRVGAGGEATALRPTFALFSTEQRKRLFLATLYALGHATMVAVLGSAALLAGALLPEWVDPILTRVVGITLIVLGLWVFYSLIQFLRGKEEFRLRSRWMLVFAGVAYLWHRLHAALEGRAHQHVHRIGQYGPTSAYAVGLIHGIGAETGSQVLLIAAVGGSTDRAVGILLMVSFIVGLVVSNSIIAVLTASGFVSAQSRRGIYVSVGILAGVFSLVVGTFFLFDLANELPDLQRMLGVIGA
jgi:high-affinity nickel-transport protein